MIIRRRSSKNAMSRDVGHFLKPVLMRVLFLRLTKNISSRTLRMKKNYRKCRGRNGSAEYEFQ